MFGYGIQMSVFGSAIFMAMQKINEQKLNVENTSVEEITKQWQSLYDIASADFASGKDITAELARLVPLTQKMYAAKMMRDPNWTSQMNDPGSIGKFLAELKNMHALYAKFIFKKWDTLYNKATEARDKGEDTREIMHSLLDVTDKLYEYEKLIKEMFGESGEGICRMWPQINPDRISGFLDKISGCIEKTISLDENMNSDPDRVFVGITTRFGKLIAVWSAPTRESLCRQDKEQAADTARAQARLYCSFSRLELRARKRLRAEDKQSFEAIVSVVKAEAAEFVKEVKRLNICLEPGLIEEVAKFAEAKPDISRILHDQIFLTNVRLALSDEDQSTHDRVMSSIRSGDFRNAYTILTEEMDEVSAKIEADRKYEIQKYYLMCEQAKKDLAAYYTKLENGQLPDAKAVAEIKTAMLALAKEIDTFIQKEIQLEDAMNVMKRRGE